MFSSEFCRMLKNIFFTEHFRATAVIVSRLNFHIVESWKVLSSKYSLNNTNKLVGENAKNDW